MYNLFHTYNRPVKIQCTLHALFLKNSKLICSKNGGTYAEINYTANVYRTGSGQGLYGEIRVQGFQIYGDCMLPAIPVILKSPHSDFHCNI